jgi:hypothetical protein
MARSWDQLNTYNIDIVHGIPLYWTTIYVNILKIWNIHEEKELECIEIRIIFIDAICWR